MQAAGSTSQFQETGMYQTEPVSLGAALLFGTAVFFILCCRKRECIAPVYRKAGVMAFSVGALALVMSTCYFPWDALQGLNRVTGLLVSMIQFPTRLTIIPTLCMTFVACVACEGIRQVSGYNGGESQRTASLKADRIYPMQEREGKGFFVLLCAFCIIFSLYQTNDILLKKEAVHLYSAEGMGHSNVLGGEYLPKNIEVDNRYHDAEGSGGL